MVSVDEKPVIIPNYTKSLSVSWKLVYYTSVNCAKVIGFV